MRLIVVIANGVLCILCAALSGVTLTAQEYVPSLAPASREGELAINGFRFPEGMQATLFAAEPDVANIVAFAFDEQGRVYVCETYRQDRGVVDNRGHMDWLLRDLSLQTVDERRAMFEEFLGEAVRDYAVHHDRIRLLEDTNRDGRADSSTVFADGFNDVVSGTGAGVLARKGDVYYTCIPDLWLLRDTDDDGVADHRRTLSSGYGVRVAFRGHDLHGLVMGPDGRIYFSVGDRGYNVTTPEGERLVRPDTGAVFRCDPDGSHLEVFAYGLRNPQELAFDDYGNLWTVDNNSDSGDRARLVYLAEGGDSGWRMYYQYLDDRGPWNRERMWFPYREDEETTARQPAFIVPPIAHLSDGPSGLVAYPGAGLPDRYAGHFFLVDFRGTAGMSGIRSFAVEPAGATFQMTDEHQFLWSILATDVDFSYDGRMFVSDWVDGWTGTGRGRLYAFHYPELAVAPEIEEADLLMRQGFERLTHQRLVTLLSHPDRRIRMEAQFTLVNRGEAGTLLQVAQSADHEFARLHAVWGLGQLARVIPRLGPSLVGLLQHSDAEVVAQAACIIGDVPESSGESELIRLVNTGTPRQKYFAAIALGQLRASSAFPALVELLADNADEDPLLRHSAIMGLTGAGEEQRLRSLANHDSRSVRLGAVVALRRLQLPFISDFLADADSAVRDEAARAIHDLSIAEALPALAAAVPQGQTEETQRRIFNANFRLGGDVEVARMVVWAADDDLPLSRRREILQALLHWCAPSPLDRVTNEFRPAGTVRLDARMVKDALAPILPELLEAAGELREPAVRLAAEYGIDDVTGALHRFAGDVDSPPELRVASLFALAKLEIPDLTDVVQLALQDDSAPVRAVARQILVKEEPEQALDELSKVITKGDLTEQQQALILLADISSPAADELVIECLDRLIKGEIPLEIQLDLLETAASRTSNTVRARLATIENQSTGDPLASYRVCLAGGDSRRGRDIFFGGAAASCRRCHVVDGEGSAVGPDLSGVAREQTREYLLESIINPNAKIAKGFETVVCLMQDGRVYSGIVKGETDSTLSLMQPMGAMILVPVAEIEERASGKSGMPEDLVKSLSRREIRDLVEFLSTLKEPAVAVPTEHR